MRHLIIPRELIYFMIFHVVNGGSEQGINQKDKLGTDRDQARMA